MQLAFIPDLCEILIQILMSRFLSVYLLICLYDVNYTIKILFQSWYNLSLGVSVCSWLTF